MLHDGSFQVQKLKGLAVDSYFTTADGTAPSIRPEGRTLRAPKAGSMEFKSLFSSGGQWLGGNLDGIASVTCHLLVASIGLAVGQNWSSCNEQLVSIAACWLCRHVCEYPSTVAAKRQSPQVVV